MKTYGTYTDCMGCVQTLDEFHMHELLDRMHLLCNIFESAIENHPATLLVKDDVDDIASKLRMLYQRVGKIEHLDGSSFEGK